MVIPDASVPGRGDVVWLDFTPQRGHEQAGRRARTMTPWGWPLFAPSRAKRKDTLLRSTSRTGMASPASFWPTRSRAWTGAPGMGRNAEACPTRQSVGLCIYSVFCWMKPRPRSRNSACWAAFLCRWFAWPSASLLPAGVRKVCLAPRRRRNAEKLNHPIGNVAAV